MKAKTYNYRKQTSVTDVVAWSLSRLISVAACSLEDAVDAAQTQQHPQENTYKIALRSG